MLSVPHEPRCYAARRYPYQQSGDKNEFDAQF